MQSFEAEVEITHINVRKEGEEKETLALDLKMSMMAEAGLVDSLMCEDLNDGEAERCFWMANEEGTPRFEQMDDVKFTRSYSNVNVEVMMLVLESCKLSKFSFKPMKGRKAELLFQVAIKEPHPMAVDRLASMLMNSMPAKFYQPQGDLLAQQQ